MLTLDRIDVEADCGIVQDTRYFRRPSPLGRPSKRQITLIEREQIAEHARSLARRLFAPGAVRSNIETEGIRLAALVGAVLQVGNAQILVTGPRDPCEKMDAIAPGLRRLMNYGKQGVLGRVLKSGTIRVGDNITILSEP